MIEQYIPVHVPVPVTHPLQDMTREFSKMSEYLEEEETKLRDNQRTRSKALAGLAKVWYREGYTVVCLFVLCWCVGLPYTPVSFVGRAFVER